MINVISKTCLDCKKQPVFNIEGETKGIYCSEHKKPGMINVKNKTCLDCKKIPVFNIEGETKAIYCSDHKKLGMVNVISKTCLDCKKIPVFNIEGKKQAIYCSDHKKPGMVNVISKTCLDCKTQASFGYVCDIVSHCAKHKKQYMFKNPNRECSESNCDNQATHGKTEPITCEDHSQEDYICFLVKKCNLCKRENEILNKKGECQICTSVSIYKESKRYQKIKEQTMLKYLRENIKQKEVYSDSVIDRTCNSYRPDVLYDCGTHIVVIECDENQHKNYNWESCHLNRSLKHSEEKRMFEIAQAYGLPSIFLRWNPDSFRVNDILVKKYSQSKRLDILSKWVSQCIEMKDASGIKYKQLFYDEYNESDITFVQITEEGVL